jgi:hypothetical protein
MMVKTACALKCTVLSLLRANIPSCGVFGKLLATAKDTKPSIQELFHVFGG